MVKRKKGKAKPKVKVKEKKIKASPFKKSGVVKGTKRKGPIDLPCAECGDLVFNCDADTKTVHCSRCTQIGIAPPPEHKEDTRTEEEKDMAKAKKAAQKAAGLTGRVSKFAGMYLYRTVKHNPRRPSAFFAPIWDKMTDGMTYEALQKLGGRPQDVQYEIDYERMRAFQTKPTKAPKKYDNIDDVTPVKKVAPKKAAKKATPKKKAAAKK